MLFWAKKILRHKGGVMLFDGVKKLIKEWEELEKRKKHIEQLKKDTTLLKEELSEMYRENRKYLTNGLSQQGGIMNRIKKIANGIIEFMFVLSVMVLFYLAMAEAIVAEYNLSYQQPITYFKYK